MWSSLNNSNETFLENFLFSTLPGSGSRALCVLSHVCHLAAWGKHDNHPLYRGENCLVRLSHGQAVLPRDAASWLEARESGSRLAYVFTLHSAVPILPPPQVLVFYTVLHKTNAPFLLISQTAGPLRAGTKSSSLMSQKHQPPMGTHCSCAPQKLTELRRLHGTSWNSLGLRKPVSPLHDRFLTGGAGT